jgi:hypothetical protein
MSRTDTCSQKESDAGSSEVQTLGPQFFVSAVERERIRCHVHKARGTDQVPVIAGVRQPARTKALGRVASDGLNVKAEFRMRIVA